MRKVLETLKVLFWGNAAVFVIGLYVLITATIGITVAFCEALTEIWTNDSHN